jgi:hypothetical protein
MKKIYKTTHIALTVLLIPLSILAYLAGVDIYHGNEPTLTTEWNILTLHFWLCFFYILLSVLIYIIERKKSN